MTVITLFTDPHLGVTRGDHSTRASSQRLQDELFDQAMAIVSASDYPVFCLGDLFDKAFNPEKIIAQGIAVASHCEMTLSGNHDETNREGTITSLQVVEEAGCRVCRSDNLSDAYFDCFTDGKYAGVYLVPHHASQELFLAACQNAANHAAVHRNGLASVLFLHCNYNFGLAVTDNTLNLPEDFALQLLESFDKIFIGHEHNPSTHLDDRVIILGNTHPTSFADISDKYTYQLDLETAEYTRQAAWVKKDGYRELKVGDDPGDLTGVMFIDVVGQESIGSAAEVTDYINSLWKAAEYEAEGQVCSQLMLVRNKVVLKDALDGVDTSSETVQLEDLQTKLRSDLNGSDLLPLFEELLQQVTA